MVFGNYIYTGRRINWIFIPYHIQKINSKSIKDKYKSWNYKISRIKQMEKASQYWSGKRYFGFDSRSSCEKCKNRQMWIYQIKSFQTAKKKPISRLKTQLIEWEKIFVSHTFNKKLLSKIYREYKQLNIKK